MSEAEKQAVFETLLAVLMAVPVIKWIIIPSVRDYWQERQERKKLASSSGRTSPS